MLGARLGEPFDYWNALGGMAALAVPGALWVGSRRDAPRAAAALAYPALGVLLLTIMLTQSRGALAAAVLAALVWLAFVPLRLRTAPVLAVAAVGVAPGDRVGAVPGGLHGRAAAARGARGRGRAPSAC